MLIFYNLLSICWNLIISKYIIEQMKNCVKTNGKNCILIFDDGTYFLGIELEIMVMFMEKFVSILQ